MTLNLQPLSLVIVVMRCIGVVRGGGGGAGPLNNLRGGGGNIPFGPLNNPPTFSFNFYVKQEKMTNVPSLRVK